VAVNAIVRASLLATNDYQTASGTWKPSAGKDPAGDFIMRSANSFDTFIFISRPFSIQLIGPS
jgi:hypothetical protein